MRNALIRVARVLVVWARLPALGSAQSDQSPDLVSALETTEHHSFRMRSASPGKACASPSSTPASTITIRTLEDASAGCKVVGGYDFVGDNYTSSDSTPMPDPDPDDTCNGHGTHVAGIAAAKAASPERRDGRRAGRRASRLPGVRLQRHGHPPISSWPRWNVPSLRGPTS